MGGGGKAKEGFIAHQTLLEHYFVPFAKAAKWQRRWSRTSFKTKLKSGFDTAQIQDFRQGDGPPRIWPQGGCPPCFRISICTDSESAYDFWTTHKTPIQEFGQRVQTRIWLCIGTSASCIAIMTLGHVLHSPQGVMFSKHLFLKPNGRGGGRTHGVSALLLVSMNEAQQFFPCSRMLLSWKSPKNLDSFSGDVWNLSGIISRCILQSWIQCQIFLPKCIQTSQSATSATKVQVTFKVNYI